MKKQGLVLSLAITLISTGGLLAQVDPPRMKAAQARELIDELEKSPFDGQGPFLGVIGRWDCSLSSFTDRIEANTLCELYNQFATRIETLYQARVKVYISRDNFGYPTQILVVNFMDHDSGDSRLVIGISQGNDSTGFFFRHSDGAFKPGKQWALKKMTRLDSAFTDR